MGSPLHRRDQGRTRSADRTGSQGAGARHQTRDRLSGRLLRQPLETGWHPQPRHGWWTSRPRFRSSGDPAIGYRVACGRCDLVARVGFGCERARTSQTCQSSQSELTSTRAAVKLPEAMSLSTPRSRRKLRASTTRRALRASVKLPAGERYTALRKAEFLLNNAATKAEYEVARREVRGLGLDPDAVPHVAPRPR